MRSFLLLFLVFPLAACAMSPAPAGQSGYAGSAWRFVSIDGEAPASEKARLEFRDDGLGVNVGCNGMGGPWRVEGQRLIAGPLVQTQMYCEGPVWSQEQAVGALLSSAPEIRRNGERLTLSSSGHRAELERIDAAA